MMGDILRESRYSIMFSIDGPYYIPVRTINHLSHTDIYNHNYKCLINIKYKHTKYIHKYYYELNNKVKNVFLFAKRN